MDTFWTRFIREYTTKLNAYPKWTKPRSNVGIGDVVVTLEEKYRGKWPLGRIVDVHATRDGFVRAVDVMVNDRVLKRDVQKVVVILRAEEESESLA